ncbi:MAG TPA: alpha/beta hydrolase [Flavisolibacter sp.]|jgi:hypothetical protein
MPLRFRSAKIRSLLRWVFWVLLVQVLLMNISAAFYAHKFTHFYDAPQRPGFSSPNIFSRTWKLFVGPRFYKQPGLSEPDFPVEHITLTLSNGLPIEGWYAGNDSAKGCVILFHGISVNKSYVINEAAMFRQMGYNVLLVDFRAHGRSDGNNSTFGVEETGEVQKAFVFAQGRGNRNIILYGVSMGAAVCLKAVAEKKVQPAALIADMPFGCLQDHMRARARMHGFPSQPFAFLVTFWAGVERGFNGFNHSPTAYAREVNCPVLLQWGDKDPYVSRSETESIFNNLPAQKKLAIYEGAGHESFLNREPVQWKTQVTEFLASCELLGIGN